MRRAALAILAAAAGLLAVAGLLLLALRPPRLPVPERDRLVLRDVTLVEAGRAPRPGRTLVVADGRIDSITSAAVGRHAPAEAPDLVGRRAPAEAPDLAGLFVAPGLMDLHVHYPPAVAVGNPELWSLLFLAHGVTAVRELGSIDGSSFAMRERIRAGDWPGPRIQSCGAILDGDPPAFPTNRVVRDAAEGRAAVAEQVARGADCIKAYNMLSPDALAGIRAAAAEAGLPLVGHLPHATALESGGIVDLQHGTGAVRVDRARVGRLDFRTADWSTVDAARIARVACFSRHHGVSHTPTLLNADLRRLLARGPDAQARAMREDTGLRHLPAYWPAVWSALWGPPFAEGGGPRAAAFEHFRERQAALAGGLHAAGAEVRAGTDTLMPYVAPGSSLHGELRALEQAGIPTAEVWRIATRTAGAALGVAGLGTLAPGAPADLLVLRRDPGRHGLGALREIEAVVADGRLYRRTDLEAALARFDAHFHGRLHAGTMDAVLALVLGRFAPDGSPAAGSCLGHEAGAP